MVKKILVTFAALAIIGACVLGAGALAQPDVAPLPVPIEADSPCPATGCASGTCHGFDNVPEPDGIHEMVCPEAGCAAVECHAWDTLATRYHQASDASLNLWIIMPVVLVIALLIVVRKVR